MQISVMRLGQAAPRVRPIPSALAVRALVGTDQFNDLLDRRFIACSQRKKASGHERQCWQRFNLVKDKLNVAIPIRIGHRHGLTRSSNRARHQPVPPETKVQIGAAVGFDCLRMATVLLG